MLNSQVAAAPPPPPASPPADDERRVELQVRAGIDERRAVVLGCTGGETAMVVAAYDSSGAVTFSLAGVHAGSAAEACVRSQFGQPRIEAGGAGGAVVHVITGSEPVETSGGWSPVE